MPTDCYQLPVQLVSIGLQRLDGEPATAIARTLEEAARTLRLWGQNAPSAGAGYHRVAYVLRFDNGEEFPEIFRLRRDLELDAIVVAIKGQFATVLSRRPVGTHKKSPVRTQLLLPSQRYRDVLQKRAAAVLDRYQLV
ncbi:MAG TPA: hypothetical protein VHL09_09065 [Dehalococcoidia bacterium]|nr:hypothetical protein [Dehalococcoidia bacterium]